MSRQQQGQESSGMEGLYYSAFVVIVAAGSWYNYHASITHALFTVSLYQAYAMLFPIQLLGDALFYIAPILGLSNDIPGWLVGDQLIAAIQLMTTTAAEDINIGQLLYVLSIVGLYFSVFTTPVWLALSAYLFFSDITERFRNVYTFETLRTDESENWPYISTVVGQKLIENGLDDGVFAMAQQPMQFAKINDLLDHHTINGRPAVTVNRVRAHQVFCLQMGPTWNGNLQGLPPHVLALFAAFAAKAEHDTKSCDVLLRQIAASSIHGNKNLDFSGTYTMLEKHLQSMRIARAVGPHAYLLPAMASLLELARDDGVLASAEFLWLKTVDRPLWYMLSCVGRKTAFPEVSGPYGHWIVEKRLRRPLYTPMVDEAITGLEEAVSEVIYKPDEN